ncbi:hypothetical protein Pcinc_018932 [Petrolisthes cinctipes]|nr:hypothetical protein Pcinc_018932 [Petrolisthes cinctipes]
MYCVLEAWSSVACRRRGGVVVSGATQGVEGGLVELVVWRVEWHSFCSLESGQESHMGWGVEWWSRMDVCRDFMEGSHTDGEVGTEVTQKWEFYAACLELGAGRQVGRLGRSSDRNSCVKSVVCPAAKSSEVTQSSLRGLIYRQMRSPDVAWVTWGSYPVWRQVAEEKNVPEECVKHVNILSLEIHRILDNKFREVNGLGEYEMSYKIKWQGYPEGEKWTSWVPESDMTHAWDLVENWQHQERVTQTGSAVMALTAHNQARRVEDREFFDKVNKGELTLDGGEDLYTRIKSRRAKIQGGVNSPTYPSTGASTSYDDAVYSAADNV